MIAEDRFDIEYDPARVTVAAMLASIRELGYEPVPVPAGDSPVAPASLDIATLPPALRVLFDEAARAGRPVLLDVTGPG